MSAPLATPKSAPKSMPEEKPPAIRPQIAEQPPVGLPARAQEIARRTSSRCLCGRFFWRPCGSSAGARGAESIARMTAAVEMRSIGAPFIRGVKFGQRRVGLRRGKDDRAVVHRPPVEGIGRPEERDLRDAKGRREMHHRRVATDDEPRAAPRSAASASRSAAGASRHVGCVVSGHVSPLEGIRAAGDDDVEPVSVRADARHFRPALGEPVFLRPRRAGMEQRDTSRRRRARAAVRSAAGAQFRQTQARRDVARFRRRRTGRSEIEIMIAPCGTSRTDESTTRDCRPARAAGSAAPASKVDALSGPRKRGRQRRAIGAGEIEAHIPAAQSAPAATAPSRARARRRCRHRSARSPASNAARAVPHPERDVRLRPGRAQQPQRGRGQDQVADALELEREDFHLRARAPTRYASSSRARKCSHVKFSTTRCRPAAPSRAQRSRSRYSRSIAAASASGSFGGMIRPFTPSSTTSPDSRVVICGSPHAAAS